MKNMKLALKVIGLLSIFCLGAVEEASADGMARSYGKRKSYRRPSCKKVELPCAPRPVEECVVNSSTSTSSTTFESISNTFGGTYFGIHGAWPFRSKEYTQNHTVVDLSGSQELARTSLMKHKNGGMGYVSISNYRSCGFFTELMAGYGKRAEHGSLGCLHEIMDHKVFEGSFNVGGAILLSDSVMPSLSIGIGALHTKTKFSYQASDTDKTVYGVTDEKSLWRPEFTVRTGVSFSGPSMLIGIHHKLLLSKKYKDDFYKDISLKGGSPETNFGSIKKIWPTRFEYQAIEISLKAAI